MLTRDDLAAMPFKELKKLQKLINSAVENHYKWQVSRSVAEAQQAATKYGVEVQDVIEALQTGKRAPKTARPPRPAKYHNPHNKSQKWSGVGRKPQWFQDLIDGGLTPEDLEIR